MLKRVVNPSIINQSVLIGSNQGFHTSCIRNKIDQKWRRENRLPVNTNSFGPLTNLPDFSFTDGRPTPMGSHQKERLYQQREMATKIVTMCTELNFAKDRFQKNIIAKKEEKKAILENKLMPKGHLLLKKFD